MDKNNPFTRLSTPISKIKISWKTRPNNMSDIGLPTTCGHRIGYARAVQAGLWQTGRPMPLLNFWLAGGLLICERKKIASRGCLAQSRLISNNFGLYLAIICGQGLRKCFETGFIKFIGGYKLSVGGCNIWSMNLKGAGQMFFFAFKGFFKSHGS